jgi:hypothetical protein
VTEGFGITVDLSAHPETRRQAAYLSHRSSLSLCETSLLSLAPQCLPDRRETDASLWSLYKALARTDMTISQLTLQLRTMKVCFDKLTLPSLHGIERIPGVLQRLLAR